MLNYKFNNYLRRHYKCRRAEAKSGIIEGSDVLNTTDGSAPVLEHKEISSSQMSYDNRIANLARLISLLTAEPGYVPNENDLKITTLNTLVTSMKTKNTAVINSSTALSNARISRNKLLYNDGTGLFDISVAVKAYIKSVFGATSPEYKQVIRIKFTKSF